VRIAAGLPLCGYENCKFPFDGERILKTGLPLCGRRKCWIPAGIGIAGAVKRAEDEAFALLKGNWPAVKRVTNALCRRDRLTAIELDALIAGPDSTSPDSTSPDSEGKQRRRPKPTRPKSAHSKQRQAIAGTGPDSGGPSMYEPVAGKAGPDSGGPSIHEPNMHKPVACPDAS
jgi:hypothetical protein